MVKISIGGGVLALCLGSVLALAAQEAKQEDDRAAAVGYDGGLTCVLNVKNMPAALAWYRDVLGFKLLYRMDETGWCELATPVAHVNVGLAQRKEDDTGSAAQGSATLTFGVRDIERARAELTARKVTFDGPTKVMPDLVKLAYFKDPDGNRLTLYESLMKQ